MSGIIEKPLRALTPQEYASTQKPLGERIPYPGKGLGYVVGADGTKKQTRFMGPLKKPLMVTSSRSLDEVEGLLLRDMPTPDMLKSFFELMSMLDPRNPRRVVYYKGAPGAGKTFQGELAGRVMHEKGALKIDCTGMNLYELFFETVLDFNADKRFYDALNTKVERYNAAQTDEERNAVLNPLSVDILDNCLGAASVVEGGKIIIDWAVVKHAHKKENGDIDETHSNIERAIKGLRQVSAKEGLDNLGGNALGMATQEGPAWQAYKEGRILILDELNRAKRGTFGVIHGWMQFMIGLDSECRVRNPLKEKGDQTKEELHFKRSEMACGHFVYATGNTEDDSDEVLELPEALSSRTVPDPIANATVEGWQHRWCQILTGLPVSTLYKIQAKQADADPDAFAKKLLEWRQLAEDREVPAHQLRLLRRWQDVVEATENLATFMHAVSQTVNPDSEWHRAGNLVQLLDDISETFKRELSADYRKINYFLQKAALPKPVVQPPEDDSGAQIIPLITEMDLQDRPEDIQNNIGTHLSYVILDWIMTNTYERGKSGLGNQFMTLAAECALIDPQLAEGMPGTRKSVAGLLDDNPFDDTDNDVRLELIRDVLCDYLRHHYPDIQADNDDLMPVSIVRQSVEEIARDSDGVFVFNHDRESLYDRPMQSGRAVDTIRQKGDDGNAPSVDSLISQYAFLSSLAAPGLRDHNLSQLWTGALSESGVASLSVGELSDESLAMADNLSQTDIAVTTVMVQHEDHSAAAKMVPLHIVWNKALDRVMVVGEGSVDESLKRAFNNARIAYVDKTRSGAENDFQSALSFVVGGSASLHGETIRKSFMMRNIFLDEGKYALSDSLGDMLLKREQDCFLPQYLVKTPEPNAV